MKTSPDPRHHPPGTCGSLLPDGCQQRFDRIDEKLEAIHEQASKTNGRVTKLEKASIILLTALAVLLATNPEGLIVVFKTIGAWIH